MPRPSHSAERRTKLIREVARTFAQLGYRRTTTAELARRCRVRENVLYRLWPDKKAMFIASIDFVFDLSAEIWKNTLGKDAADATPAEKLLDYEAEHHGEFGFYRIVFAALSESDDPDVRKAIQRMYGRFQEFIRQQIIAHRNMLSPLAESDAGLLAWAFLGLGTMSNLGREFGLLSDSERARLLREVGRLLLHG